jgi:hypothetical protein
MKAVGLVRRVPRLRTVMALAGLLAVIPACSDDKSYAVVTVRMAAGEVNDVAQFVVYVENGPTRNSILYYPQVPRGTRDGTFRLTPQDSIDFSVSFASSYAGLLKIGVEARNVNEVLGYGAAEKSIDPGHKIELDVSIQRGARAPVLGVPDAGAPDTSPVSACAFTNPAATCGPGQTCVVSCSGAMPLGKCAPGGTGKDNDLCRDNQDCEPGTQCFNYTCGRVCRKFCNTDADCSGGSCNRRVSCNMPTEQRYCSRACDPRGTATGGCPGSFRCLLFNENPSCDCTEPTRTGGDGAECEFTTNCLPGFMCVMMGSPKPVCRPICKRTEPDCAPGRTCAELADPLYVTWSACVPTM